MIRIGRVIYDSKGIPTFPSFDGFEPIVVLMQSHSEWGSLGPYHLWDEENRNFESYYQMMKIYEFVPATTQYYSRWDKTIIWSHPYEIHFKNGKPTEEYWKWREKGFKNKYYVRYPVGFHHRHKCLFSLIKRENISDEEKKDPKYIDCGDKGIYEKLDYIQARKEIYMKEYCRLVKKEPKFKELQDKLKNKINLLIMEVDGPHQESLQYYKEKYNVDDDFIVNNTMLVNEKNINIMLNDPTHPFGHGYCLAVALLNKENEWNKDLLKNNDKKNNNQKNNKINDIINKDNDIKNKIKMTDDEYKKIGKSAKKHKIILDD